MANTIPAAYRENTIPAAYRELFQKKSFAHRVTLMPEKVNVLD